MELTLLSLVNDNQEPTCNPGKHRPGKSIGNLEGGTEIDIIRWMSYENLNWTEVAGLLVIAGPFYWRCWT
jgi:hypothetical protein